MNIAALDLRALKRRSSGGTPVPRSRRPAALQREAHCPGGLAAARAGSPTPSESAAVRPACRLRLEGRHAHEGACDILELSAEGVTIVLHPSREALPGQQGQLLIGPAEGAHYTVPVAVRWVKPSPTEAVVGLAFPATERWTYSQA